MSAVCSICLTVTKLAPYVGMALVLRNIALVIHARTQQLSLKLRSSALSVVMVPYCNSCTTIVCIMLRNVSVSIAQLMLACADVAGISRAKNRAKCIIS
jgi:hypothetical protein